MFVKPFKILLLCFCCLIAQLAFGQSIVVETQQYNEENGLSSYANYIHKDSRGIIWVGTQYGLYRFEGDDFTHFNENVGLPFRQIMEIYEDSAGWFWLYKSCVDKPNCDRDLAFFHPVTRQALTFEERFGNQLTIKASQIQGIGQDSLNVFFTADHKLIYWSSEKGIREIPIKGLSTTPTLLTKVNDQILGAYYLENPADTSQEYKEQDIWYVAIDLDGNLRQPPKPFSIKGLQVSNLTKIRRKAFQFDRIRIKNVELSITQDGALTIDTLPYELPRFSHSTGYYYFDEQLFVNNQGEIFHTELGPVTDLATTYLDKLRKPFYRKFIPTAWISKKRLSNDNQSFRQVYIGPAGRHVFFDWDTKIAWLADPNGITTWHFKPQRFRHVLNDKNNKQLASTTLSLDDENVLLVIVGDLFLYSQHKKLKSISFPVLYATCHEAGDPNFWAINLAHLLKINGKNLSFSEYPIPKVIGQARSLFKTGNQIWIAGEAGIYRYDIERDSFSEYPQYNEFEILRSSKVHFFREAFEGHLWIGTDSGLYLCSQEKGILARYGNTEKGSNYLPAGNFFHLTNAKHGGYWLATMSGLIRWEWPSPSPPSLGCSKLKKLCSFFEEFITNKCLIARGMYCSPIL